MPKRDEELEYEYDDEETADDEFEDDDEYEDDEYEDEEGGSGWARKAIVAGIAILAIGGGGTYAYLQGMLPFSPKKVPEPVAASTSPYANPNGFGKVQASASLPAAEEVVGEKVDQASTSPVAAVPEQKTDAVPDQKPRAESEKPAKVTPKAGKPAEEVPSAAEETTPEAPKPVKIPVKPKLAVKPKPAAVAQPVVVPVAKQAVANAGSPSGTFAIQCGAFGSAANADNLSRILNSKGFSAWVANGTGASAGAFSVRSTVVNSQAKASELTSKFASAGHPGTIVPAGRGRSVLQLGVFSSRERADALAAELKSKGLFVSVAGGKAKMRTPNRVFVGKFGSMAQAQATAAKIRQQGVPAIAVKL